MSNSNTDNPYYDKIYKEICSEKTLQSNSKGFFMDFVAFVQENLDSKWIKHVFGKLRTDKERVRIIFANEKSNAVVSGVLSNVQAVYRKKNAEFARARRLEADSLGSADLKKSLALYSQSVLRSPKPGEIPTIDDGLSLPLALFGRSQTLIKLKKYTKALSDIQLSLKENLPNTHKAEAYWKMGICFRALNDSNRAEVSFNLAQKLLSDKIKLEELKLDRVRTFTSEINKNRRAEPPLLSKARKDYPAACYKLSVKSSRDFGRHMVANEEIKTGETLVVEEPYVACLLPEKFGTHCHHCLDRLTSPVGCDECSGVAFCKTECKEAATSSYHRYECKFLDLLIGSGMSILAHAALRIITQNSLERTLEIYRERGSERIFTLCTNSNLRSPEDFLQRTLMATFLLSILKKSGYFGASLEEPSENELRIAELILFYLQILQFNTHEIDETLHTAGHRFRHTKTDYIGVALYPTASLFNHDCFPGVSRHFVGEKIVIRASRPFQVNDIIPENYGPIFTRKSLAERQRSLSSRYWFNCKCEACVRNWPKLTTGLNNKPSKRIRCPGQKCSYIFTLPVANETLTCPKCKQEVSLSHRLSLLKWCEEQYKQGFEKMDNDQEPEKAIDILSVAIDTFYGISVPPHEETHSAEETLRMCMADSGNVYETLKRKTES